jgi:hypothetical protein
MTQPIVPRRIRSFVLQLALGATLAATAGAAHAQQFPWIGLSPDGAQLFHQQGVGQLGPNAGDELGYAVAAGDFNHDGFDDLAVGVRSNDCSAAVGNCGAVVVRFGFSVAPLGAFVTLDPAAPGAPLPAAADERYGGALAVGDFNHDGYEDLAVGIPRDVQYLTHSDVFPFGGVQIHYGLHGSLGSIQWVAEHEIHQPRVNGFDVRALDQRFGHALAVGDFDHDGFDDLAIGVPWEDGVGAVQVIFGGEDSLDPGHPGNWYIEPLDLGALPQLGDAFGSALAAGDFNGDGFDDLAIGVPGRDGGDAVIVENVGMVAVVYGSEDGLGAGASWLSEDSVGGEGNSEEFDSFGAALTAGDFNGDAIDDLAIGTPLEGYEPVGLDAGGVSVVLGRHLLPLPGPGRKLRPGDYPVGMIPDTASGSPAYGSALAAADFDGNGFTDLAIGGPNADFGLVPQAGAVAIVYGDGFLLSDGFESGDTSRWKVLPPI